MQITILLTHSKFFKEYLKIIMINKNKFTFYAITEGY